VCAALQAAQFLSERANREKKEAQDNLQRVVEGSEVFRNPTSFSFRALLERPSADSALQRP